MRFACGDMRDHIVSHKNDHGPSYWRRRALRQQARLRIDFSEILRVVRFSTFATISASSGNSSRNTDAYSIASSARVNRAGWLGCFGSRRQGTVERERMGGDRATALIEHIWCEKIRGCSYRGGNTSLGASYSKSAMPPWRPNSAAQRNDLRLTWLNRNSIRCDSFPKLGKSFAWERKNSREESVKLLDQEWRGSGSNGRSPTVT
jgi:hypothetical protein